MRIFLGADHRGFFLKGALKIYLDELGYAAVDKGAAVYDKNDDYPDFALAVAEAVAAGDPDDRGVLMCYTGEGEAMTANKVKGIRAALCWNEPVAALARQHEDANVLVLPAGFIKEEEAKAILKRWLNTAFSGEPRHVRRMGKIAAYEQRRQ